MPPSSLSRPWPLRSNLLRAGAPARWWLLHLWLPLLAFALLTALLFGLDGDLWVADRLYAWEGGRWALQHTWLSQHVLHDNAKRASMFGAVVVLALWLGTFSGALCKRWALRAWRRPLGYVLLAVALSTGIVAGLKGVTNMDCPYDLVQYGGKRLYHGLLEANPNGVRGRCFPAGNASAGYAWLCLYFLFLAMRPRLRWLGLGIGLAAGLLLGINQQLRGEHFLGHDVWTATICWLVALGLYAWMLRGRLPREAAA